MHEIEQIHHDGFGLNDRIAITADERDPNAGGASHHYQAEIDVGGGYTRAVLDVQFQHGPRDVEGSKPGATEAVLLAVLIDRLRAFQAGPFACRENAIALTKLEEAHQWIGQRARDRARRGVLRKNVK